MHVNFFSPTITPSQVTKNLFDSVLSCEVDLLQASPSGSACPLCVLTLHRASVDGNNCTSNVD